MICLLAKKKPMSWDQGHKFYEVIVWLASYGPSRTVHIGNNKTDQARRSQAWNAVWRCACFLISKEIVMESWKWAVEDWGKWCCTNTSSIQYPRGFAMWSSLWVQAPIMDVRGNVILPLFYSLHACLLGTNLPVEPCEDPPRICPLYSLHIFAYHSGYIRQLQPSNT